MKTAVIGEVAAASSTIAHSSILPGTMASSRRRAALIGPKPRARSSDRTATFVRTSSFIHATTQRVVNEAFAEEKPHLKSLPLAPLRSVLKLERHVSHEGMVSVGGNLYSVPDATRKRIVEVHTLADEVRIFEDGNLIAAHPVLEGRNQRRVAPWTSQDGADRRSSSPQRRTGADRSHRRRRPRARSSSIKPSVNV